MSRRLLLATPFLAIAGLPGDGDAASFVLRDGEMVEGRLIAATRNTLTVLRDIGGIQQIARSGLDHVQVDTPRGTVAGVLREVEGARILIATPAGNTLWIEGDRVVADAEPLRSVVGMTEGTPPVRAARSASDGGSEPARRAEAPGDRSPTPDRPAGEARAQPDLGAAKQSLPLLAEAVPRPRERGLAPGRSFGGLVSEAAAAPAGEATEALPARSAPPLVRIAIGEPDVGEGEGEVGFSIELSHASDQPIRFVYSTVDGQANAGQDYEASQGVFTLPPGETRHSLATAILNDGETEDPEQFFLFVTSDDERATIEEKWHTITIQDDD